MEFAGIFNGLGVETTLIYRGPNILRGFDDDVRAHLDGEMERRGIKVILGCEHTQLEKTDGGLVSHLTSGHDVETDVVHVRHRPRALHRGPRPGDRRRRAERRAARWWSTTYSQTNVDNIWAVGDVTDRINLTPVAIREGAAFAETEFYGRPTTLRPRDGGQRRLLPAAGRRGRSHRGGGAPRRTQGRHLPLGVPADEGDLLRRRRAHADEAGGRPASERVLGCHIVGPDAPEMIQMAAIAIKMGVTKAQWDQTCAVHPTAAEELVTMREPYMALGL